VTSLDAVTVSGAAGAAPRVNFGHPFTAARTDRRVLTPGSGAPVVAGQRVSVDYVGVNGTDGKVFDSSFGKKPAIFMVDPGQVIKGFASGLVGVKVGSRVLLAIPPNDGYGIQGQPAAGIGPTDTLLFVIDVRSANQVLTRATGVPVKPVKGLPTVKLDAKGKPTITLPGGAPPASLLVQPLILGKGPKVTAKQTITVHYTGVVWPGGRQFDSSWAKGAPAQFPIGAGQVIAGWDEGLVGRTVGSQVLMVIPPDKGYGAAGNLQAGIKGTDTLVFVVDILDAV
jgi:peptidylprolyl isomerase